MLKLFVIASLVAAFQLAVSADDTVQSGATLSDDNAADAYHERPAKYRSDPSRVMMKNVYVLSPDRKVTNVSPTPGEGFYGGACIHPDGTDVVFPGAAWGYSRIWKYTFATGKISALTPAKFVSINPSYSTDGKLIVFI